MPEHERCHVPVRFPSTFAEIIQRNETWLAPSAPQRERTHVRAYVRATTRSRICPGPRMIYRETFSVCGHPSVSELVESTQRNMEMSEERRGRTSLGINPPLRPPLSLFLCMKIKLLLPSRIVEFFGLKVNRDGGENRATQLAETCS